MKDLKKEAEETNVVNFEGEPCVQIHPEMGYYRINTHVYHITDTGIVHVNGDLINALRNIYLCGNEKLVAITKEEFDAEVRNAILSIGIYKYV